MKNVNKRPIYYSYNAPYRGPKNKFDINNIVNSIMLDIRNVIEFASQIGDKVRTNFLFYTKKKELKDQGNTIINIPESSQMMSTLDMTREIDDLMTRLDRIKKEI